MNIKKQTQIRYAYNIMLTLIIPVIFWANVIINISKYDPVKLVILTAITSTLTFIYIIWFELITRKYLCSKKNKKTYKLAILILIKTILC